MTQDQRTQTAVSLARDLASGFVQPRRVLDEAVSQRETLERTLDELRRVLDGGEPKPSA